MKRTSIWMDHYKAHVFEYSVDGVHHKTVNPHLEANASKEHIKKFYHELAVAVGQPQTILLMGPGQAKEEFRNHCESHHPQLNKVIVKVENMKDHATEAEMLKASNDFFKEQYNWTGA